MMNAIKTSERKLENGSLRHAKSSLMDWCVGNVKIEPMATAIRATKQNAGDAKIDPWAAMMDAVSAMVRNPEPVRKASVYETRPLLVVVINVEARQRAIKATGRRVAEDQAPRRKTRAALLVAAVIVTEPIGFGEVLLLCGSGAAWVRRASGLPASGLYRTRPGAGRCGDLWCP